MTNKPFFEESYAYHFSKKGHTFVVRRAGLPYSYFDRGGTWYSVELWPEYRSDYEMGRIPGIGGQTVYRTTITLRKPYFFKIPPIKAEGEIPIKLWEHVMKKKLPNRRGLYGSNAEKRYAQLEKEVATKQSKKGYDGVVLYNQPGSVNTRYPSQLFVFKSRSQLTLPDLFTVY